MAPPSYHVHFGAGKLGLGFVLPILDNIEVPIALFQRPGSKEWEKLQKGHDVVFQVNSEDLLDCKYISDESELADVQTYIEEHRHLFVSTCRIDILQAILSVTHSFSTAVAAGGLDDVYEGLALLPSYYPDTRVYTFENDFKAVEQFRNKVNATLPGLSVISVMCDRICTTREINPVNQINTITEEFPGIAVVFSSNISYCHPFTTPRSVRRKCTPSNVVLACTPGEETFYYNRKFSLLNGIHYTMAAYAYGVLAEKGIPAPEWLAKPLSLWRTKQNVKELNLLIEARILFLLSQTDDQTLIGIYNTADRAHVFKELKAFSDTVLARINSASEDTTGRILNLHNPSAVKTKYSQHFLPLHTFLRAGGDITYTDLVAHTHSEYVDALVNWDRNVRETAEAYKIELPTHKYLPGPKFSSPVEEREVKVQPEQRALSIEVWQNN